MFTTLNPYSPGGAITDPNSTSFIGREDIFAFVRSAIQATIPTPILLYGQRRIGKSSILRQIPYHLSPEKICVYYDLQGKAGMQLDQVIYGLAREIARTLKIPKPEREEATEETFSSEFLSKKIQTLDGQRNKLVLLFDEFDVLDDRLSNKGVAAHRFVNYLGELITQHPQIGYIMVVGRKTEELSQELNSTLLKNSVQMQVGRLDREQTNKLVCGLAHIHDFLRYTEDALDYIFSLTNGHPYCTQLICFTIWSRLNISDRSNVNITSSIVEDAIPFALEHGTNGLNWIFDGLNIPEYRLFLAALAEVIDPLLGKPVPYSKIERVLLSRQIPSKQLEFSRAPKDLSQWDVIKREGKGYRFQVPMIGIWIRKERSLEVLEKEVRYTNPQAYSYYELATKAFEAGDLERAIADYRGALKFNPYFFEAQRNLAIALQTLADPEQVEETIETFERALDLDSEMPTSGFIEALLTSLELPDTPLEKLNLYYNRILDLDKSERMVPRAERILRERAMVFTNIEKFRDAEAIFQIIDDPKMANQAKNNQRIVMLVTIFIVLLGTLAGTLRLILSDQLTMGFRALLCAIFGVAIGEIFGRLLVSINYSSVPIRKVSGPISEFIDSDSLFQKIFKPRDSIRFISRINLISSLSRLIAGITISSLIGIAYQIWFGGEIAYQWVAGIGGFYLGLLLFMPTIFD